MHPEKKPTRLGSLQDYAHYLVSSLALMWVAVVAFLLGGIGVVATLFCLMQMFFNSSELFEIISFLLVAVAVGSVSFALLLFGWSSATEFTQLEPIEPLTPAKADRLPASETLVRASEQPTESQEKVLLRPAMATEEANPEELLRPAGNSAYNA